MIQLSEEKLIVAIDKLSDMLSTDGCYLPKDELYRVAALNDLHVFSSDIKNGRIKISQSALKELEEVLCMDEMNIEDICNHYGISRATHARWINSGRLPRMHKHSGGKKYNYLHECEETLKRWNAEHNDDFILFMQRKISERRCNNE